MFFPKGTILNFTSGAYSDFGSIGIVVSIKDIQLRDLGIDFVEDWKKNKEEWMWEPFADEFVAWLVAKQYVIPVEMDTIFLGDYDFSIDGEQMYKED